MIGKSITAYAPGKLILSGEHAVVHGAPALVTAINRGVTTTHDAIKDRELVIHLPDMNLNAVYDPTEVEHLCKALDVLYASFQAGKVSASALQISACQFVAYAVQPFLDYTEHGHKFTVRSTLLPGSGTGSSAAVANATLLSTQANDFRARAHATESLQHGNPSGVDLHVSREGGFHLFQQGESERLSDVSANFHLAYSGTPSSNTGACVSHVQQFSGDAALWKAFSQVTAAMSGALAQQDTLIDLVRKNHSLLVKIGVVPPRIQHFITQIEERGGAAKICGAGAVEGEAAGVIWVICEEIIEDLLSIFDFSPLIVAGDPHGTRII